MTLTEKLRAIASRIGSIGCEVSHYWRPVKNVPLLIWAETNEELFRADNRRSEMVVNGTLDFYTNVEFDETIDSIQTAMDEFALTWSLDSVQYEEETNLIHYSWNWLA